MTTQNSRHEHHVADSNGETHRIVVVGTDGCEWCRMAQRSLQPNAAKGEVQFENYETERGRKLVQDAKAEDAPAALIVNKDDKVVGACDLDIDEATGKTRLSCKFPGSEERTEIIGQ